MTQTASIADQIAAAEARRYQRGSWVTACGGKEVPMTVQGRRVLYVWHTGTREHAYLDLDTDLILSNEDRAALGL